jgi:acetylornithine deacetylase/succinyl-diaminopimelate desuccinylase-like protein
VNEQGLAELVSRLIRIPSYPGRPRQEEAVARELAVFLESQGLVPTLVEVRPGRPNLLCTVKGARPGPHLVLCGHTDTVPPNADDPGFGLSGDLVDGCIQGRGSVDMKGAVAAMATVLADLAATGGPAAGSVTLAAVMDEEMEGLGIEHLVASGFLADTKVSGAIVGEPTQNRPCLGHKGLEWLEVELVGRAAHGGTPTRGINAIAGAARFVELVRQKLEPLLIEREHPLLGRPTINFGTVRGGDQPSTVAARCTLALDRRSVPGETPTSVVRELEELLAEVEAAMPGLTTQVRPFPGGSGTLERIPFATPADDPLARAVAAACLSVTGREPAFGAFPAWTDGGMLAGPGGVPTLILGPGDLSLAHSPREALPLAELVEAAHLYAAAVREFCR